MLLLSKVTQGESISPADRLRIANVDPMDDQTYEKAEALIKELMEEYISVGSDFLKSMVIRFQK